MKRGKFKFDMLLFWNFLFWISCLVFLPFFTHFLYLPYTNPLLVAHLNALLSAFTLGRIMCKFQKWICILKMNWNSMTQKTKYILKVSKFLAWKIFTIHMIWSLYLRIKNLGVIHFMQQRIGCTKMIGL